MRTKEQFHKRITKSKAEIWKRVETNIQQFRWTEFLTGSPINYSQFALQEDSIQLLRRPDFFGFFIPTGRIKFTMDPDSKLLYWEVNPFDTDSILPIALFLSAIGIIGWTVFLIFLFDNIKWLVIILLISWIITLLITYLTYKLYKADLVSYGYRVAKELTSD